jgi:hypothetical protein
MGNSQSKLGMYNIYSNGTIYSITCNITGKVYIGSTILLLQVRINGHKCLKYNECTSKSIIENGNYTV